MGSAIHDVKVNHLILRDLAWPMHMLTHEKYAPLRFSKATIFGALT
jgi:hypothetical protein